MVKYLAPSPPPPPLQAIDVKLQNMMILKKVPAENPGESNWKNNIKNTVTEKSRPILWWFISICTVFPPRESKSKCKSKNLILESMAVCSFFSEKIKEVIILLEKMLRVQKHRILIQKLLVKKKRTWPSPVTLIKPRMLSMYSACMFAQYSYTIGWM